MGGPTAGSSRAYRLDPQSLRAQPATFAAGREPFAIDIAGSAVVFGGPGLSRPVPFAAYRGVAVRMEETREAGRVRVYLELLHSDRALTVALSVTDDPDNVAADWQEWGRVLGLPLLVVAPDGTVSAPLPSLGSLTVFPPKMRRRPAHFAKRRPRFLVRRKAGRAFGLARLTGREIIARN